MAPFSRSQNLLCHDVFMQMVCCSIPWVTGKNERRGTGRKLTSLLEAPDRMHRRIDFAHCIKSGGMHTRDWAADEKPSASTYMQFCLNVQSIESMQNANSRRLNNKGACLLVLGVHNAQGKRTTRAFLIYADTNKRQLTKQTDVIFHPACVSFWLWRRVGRNSLKTPQVMAWIFFFVLSVFIYLVYF